MIQFGIWLLRRTQVFLRLRLVALATTATRLWLSLSRRFPRLALSSAVFLEVEDPREQRGPGRQACGLERLLRIAFLLCALLLRLSFGAPSTSSSRHLDFLLPYESTHQLGTFRFSLALRESRLCPTASHRLLRPRSIVQPLALFCLPSRSDGDGVEDGGVWVPAPVCAFATGSRVSPAGREGCFCSSGDVSERWSDLGSSFTVPESAGFGQGSGSSGHRADRAFSRGDHFGCGRGRAGRRDSLRRRDYMLAGGFSSVGCRGFDGIRQCSKPDAEPLFLARLSHDVAHVEFPTLSSPGLDKWKSRHGPYPVLLGGGGGGEGGIFLVSTWREEEGKTCSCAQESDHCSPGRSIGSHLSFNPVDPPDCSTTECPAGKAEEDRAGRDGVSRAKASCSQDALPCSDAGQARGCRVSEKCWRPSEGQDCSEHPRPRFGAGRGRASFAPERRGFSSTVGASCSRSQSCSFPAESSSHCFGGAFSWARWAYRLGGFLIVPGPNLERSFKKEQVASGLSLQRRSVLLSRGSKCFQKTQAHGAPANRSEELPQQGNFLEVSGKARWLQWAKRLGVDYVVAGPDRRPNGLWRCQRSSGDDGSHASGLGAVCSRRREMGSGLGSIFAGGSTSEHLCSSAATDEPSAKSLCTVVPSSLDYGGPQLCERARHDIFEEDRDEGRRKEGWGESGKPTGGGQTETPLPKEEECASFVVGGKLDSKKDGLSSRAWRAPDEVMQFGSSFSVGRGGDESHGPDLSNSSSVADLGSGSFSCKEATSLPKTWGNMQEYSYRTWCRELLGKVMNSRTSFSSFLRSTLMAKPSAEHARANLLFPLPIPKFGIFESRKRSSRARRTCYEDRAFHILVMALNFLHSDFKRMPLDVLSLKPHPCQAATLLRLKGTLKVFGSCHGAFSVPDSGRRSMNLVSLLADLSDFVTWEGLSGSSYDRSFPGAAGGLGERRSVPYDRSRAEELTPYRPLDPSRLVLHGRAHWDPSPFLPDSLWLPFKEPNVLLWCDEPQAGLGVLKNESEKIVEELARVWDVNGLLFLRAPDEGDLRPHDTMRVFNCYKNSSCDRQITDRRSRNYLESRILGDSRGLPAAFALSVLEVRPFEQRLSICCSDRKDFYHQFAVSAARAATNVCAPAVDAEKLKDTLAYKRMLDRAKKSKSASREQRGDFLGQEPRRRGLLVPEKVHVCFGSIGQGDHLGVEFATAAHRRMLQSFGLLQEDSELRGDRVFLGDRLLEGLVIDDYYTISVEDEPLEESMMLVGDTGLSDSVAVGKMQVASGAYEAHALAGSPHKDVWDADKAKVTGAEIDSSVEARKRGLVTLGAPMQKRLALAFVSLELAGLRFSSDVLTSCLVGGWTSAAMFRRQFMAILSDLYKVCDFSTVDQNSPELVSLGAGARQELVMLAVLCPLMTTNLGAEVSPVLYATDASEQLGAFVETSVDEELARVLWRTGNRKGGYSHLMNRFEALLQKIDEDFEPHVKEDDASGISPDRPLAFRYHFIEVCGGAGKISSFLGEKGWVVGPVIDLDRSGFYDLQLLELVSWLIHLVEEGLLDSFIVEPPCTTFSAAAYPPLRSYVQPRGFDPSHCRTHIGTTLALRALTLMYIAARAMLPALLEQPLLSKMAWLEEWKRLLEELFVYERKTSSCMYGSPHRKEFRFLVANMETDAMSLRCDRSHSHVKIEGKFTKASAVYVDGLAEAIAVSFDKALARKLRLDSHWEKTKPGLEMPLLNDLLVSSDWKVGRAWRWKSRAHINILGYSWEAAKEPGKRKALHQNVNRCGLPCGFGLNC